MERRFSKLADRQAAIGRLEQIAETNLHNTLRLLYALLLDMGRRYNGACL